MPSRADRKAQRNQRRRDRLNQVDRRPVEPLVNNLPLTEVLTEEGMETIHKASMRLLSETGMLIVDYPSGVETFRQHGAKVDGEHVWIDEDTLMHFVNQAPAQFTQLARNPANSVTIGGNNTVFAPIYGPPFAADLDRGRREATLDDFNELAKLVSMIPHLHHGGGVLVEPNNIPVRTRHLDMLLSHITHHDKAFMGSSVFADNARDSVAMAEILHGKEEICENPALLSVFNASSPLRFDDRMLSSMEVYAEANQATVITPFIISGAMSPSTTAATIAQLNAETLFGICFTQMINPGAPTIYGSFLANIDMRSGAPCFGTPENTLALYAGAQMARYYKLPYRSGGNFTASRIPDAQSAYESAYTMLPTVQAGTNFVLHAAGWLEGGLIADYEKLILDVETLGMLARYVKGISLTDEDFAWDAYEENGPGKHFLGTEHTMRHYETAFYQHNVFNMDNYEKWESEGSEDSRQKANAVWKAMLKEYEAPALDVAKAEELRAFVAFRRDQIGRGRERTEWRG
ncbi:MAG: trimethylamine methyltransferase family protein [Chloroflexota bacterium]